MLVIFEPLIGRSVFIDILPCLTDDLCILWNGVSLNKPDGRYIYSEIGVIDHSNLTFADKEHFIRQNNKAFLVVKGNLDCINICFDIIWARIASLS